MQTRSKTIDDLREKLRQAEENYHWANQDRDTLRYFLEKSGIEAPSLPNWSWGEIEKCQCSECVCWCDSCAENILAGKEKITDTLYNVDFNNGDDIYSPPISIPLNSKGLDNIMNECKYSKITKQNNWNITNKLIEEAEGFCNCSKCKNEFGDLGYYKSKLVKDIKVFLIKIEKRNGHINKLKEARILFKYLTNDDCKKFIMDNSNFKEAVISKLKEFYLKENIKEAYKWYRNIFGKRMVLD